MSILLFSRKIDYTDFIRKNHFADDLNADGGCLLYEQEELQMDKIYDLIIIGSGPAGLSAAIYAQRAGLDTLVLEKEYISGGQVVNTAEVDNYPGLPGMNGYELGMKFRAHADALEAKFQIAEVKDIIIEETQKIVQTNEGDFAAKNLIISTGASHRKLGVPGEKELAGMGVSYCATCDGAFFKGRTVAVVGGGDVAVGDALFLARGCKKVYLIHRRDEFRGEDQIVKRLQEKENVEFILNTTVQEIRGEQMVESLRVLNKVTGEESELAVSGIFVAVGQIAQNEKFVDVVQLDEGGFIVAGEDCKTSEAGIYAAGDCRTKEVRQLTTAAADGAVAALAACKYIADVAEK